MKRKTKSASKRRNTPRLLQPGVMPRPLEISMLIRAYRERAYNCKLMVVATTDQKVMSKLRIAALRCENRANELAQHNDKVSRSHGECGEAQERK